MGDRNIATRDIVLRDLVKRMDPKGFVGVDHTALDTLEGQGVDGNDVGALLEWLVTDGLIDRIADDEYSVTPQGQLISGVEP